MTTAVSPETADLVCLIAKTKISFSVDIMQSWRTSATVTMTEMEPSREADEKTSPRQGLDQNIGTGFSFTSLAPVDAEDRAVEGHSNQKM